MVNRKYRKTATGILSHSFIRRYTSRSLNAGTNTNNAHKSTTEKRGSLTSSSRSLITSTSSRSSSDRGKYGHGMTGSETYDDLNSSSLSLKY